MPYESINNDINLLNYVVFDGPSIYWQERKRIYDRHSFPCMACFSFSIVGYNRRLFLNGGRSRLVTLMKKLVVKCNNFVSTSSMLKNINDAMT